MNTRAAIRYAKAVWSLASEQNKIEETNTDMKAIATVLSENPSLEAMLVNPVIQNTEKVSILKEIFKFDNKISLNLIGLLSNNKRLFLLDAITAEFNKLYMISKEEQVAQVTTATPLSDALKKQVLEKVKEITGKDASVENIINPDIIGGFILRIGDTQYDASVKNKLNVLKRNFVNGSVA
jgi:F-type H+-transporting ATPase subunit delta